MKLTALIPVYNDNYALVFCLASIVDHFDEIIIFDDASTDLTAWVAACYTTDHKNVRYVRNRGPQIGWIQARNRLAALTDSEHLFWLDADDVLCEYNAHLLKEIAEGKAPIVQLQLTEMWGDFHHTTGRLRHYDRCHMFLNRRKVRDFKWAGGTAARCVAQAPVKNGPGPLFFHIKGVKPDRRLVERRRMRRYLGAKERPETVGAYAGLDKLTEDQIHQEALDILLRSRQDRLVPTYRGLPADAVPDGAPRRPEVIEHSADRFLMVYKDGTPIDRTDRGWPA